MRQICEGLGMKDRDDQFLSGYLSKRLKNLEKNDKIRNKKIEEENKFLNESGNGEEGILSSINQMRKREILLKQNQRQRERELEEEERARNEKYRRSITPPPEKKPCGIRVHKPGSINYNA
jgi:hypothetical protein